MSPVLYSYLRLGVLQIMDGTSTDSLIPPCADLEYRLLWFHLFYAFVRKHVYPTEIGLRTIESVMLWLI